MSQLSVKYSHSIPRRALFGLPGLLTALAQRTADDLFDGNQFHDIRLELDPANWQTLRDTYLENNWYRASVSWSGVDAQCSIRSRGNGSRNPVKPSLKLSFTKFSDSGPFLGLDTFVLTNLYQDPTMLKNFLAQQLFTRAGLPAPRFSFARLTVNGEYWGVYGVGEEIDDRFLTQRFGEKAGYLYEYSWADVFGFGDRGDEAASYAPVPFEPKNNTKNPDYQPLVEMITGVTRADSPSALLAHLDRYLNPEQFLTFLAVEAYYDERDGQTGDWGVNGFYLYRFARTTQFWFLPWDKDWSFFDAQRSPYFNVEANCLAQRLLGIPRYRAFYGRELQRIAALAGGPGGWLENQLQSRLTQLRSSYRADPKRPYTNGVQEDQIQRLTAFVRQRPSSLLPQI
ncbi:MAG: CotH kinase family protein [Bryobacteraceae bacterium]|nr:CotH kinase family protein [Bryobacteraceae bacterium]